MRIDKFLKNSRMIKRRTVAQDACRQGRITVNDRIAKPGTEVKAGDVVQIQFGSSTITARVLKLPETVKKEDAASMYEIITSG